MFKIVYFLFTIFFVSSSLFGYYTLEPVKIRSKPNTKGNLICTLGQNISLQMLKKGTNWHKITTLSGHGGFVPAKSISNTWIRVFKEERKLQLIKGDTVLKQYSIALSTDNPLGDKIKEGDSGTPEGRFYICESIKKPVKKKYGSRSMHLSYPNKEDARRGLKAGNIKYKKYIKILKAIHSGKMPPQDTILGSSLRIHGGGASADWTLGCIALEDKDIADIFSKVPAKVRVEVYKSRDQFKKINKWNYVNNLVSDGIEKVIKKKPKYTAYAMKYRKLKYPGGDINKTDAVCTDVVIRALRSAGIDLQALLHEDVKLYPGRYKKRIINSDYNIDHRRVRNLKLFFDIYLKILPTNYKKYSSTFKIGDIVLLDTGIRNGTVYDHIGILVKKKNARGVPLVFNIWTEGYYAENMDLLDNDYPTVVGHYRLLHPFDY